jgi:hypothetical protein
MRKHAQPEAQRGLAALTIGLGPNFIAGVLRGLTRNSVPVTLKTKVVEIDPRGEKAQISGIGERPAKIAEGVLSAIRARKGKHVH